MADENLNPDAGQASELDKLLDAGTARIGNSPTNFNSVDDFENPEDETLETGSGHKDQHPNTDPNAEPNAGERTSSGVNNDGHFGKERGIASERGTGNENVTIADPDPEVP